MGKFETEFSVDELYQLAYEWNGLTFDAALKYCAKYRLFPEAVNIGDVQTHISKHVQEKMHEDTQIGRDTFNRWRKDGAKGPRNPETILLLDALLHDVRFLHRSFDIADKELLHQLYTLAWTFHYRLPLAIEVDDFLYRYIDYVKKERFHESLYGNKQKMKRHKGDKYDTAVKDSHEDLYICALLDAFYKEFHCILIDNKITNFHAVKYNEEIILAVEYENELFFIDWATFIEQFEEILMKRQACLEKFGDNLRTLFLGGDLNA